MKKRVFFLLLAAFAMPLAVNAQHNASVHIDSTIDACVSYTWPVNGATYSTSGVYTVLQGDTLYILDLSIHQEYTINVSTPIQGGCTYTWGDSIYTTPGQHTQTFSSVAGCDSTVTITLTLATSAAKSYDVTACESYIWKGDTLTSTGVITVTDTTNPQCDSLLTLNLTIIQPEQKGYDTTINACERTRFRFAPSAPWNTVTEDGTVLTSDAFSHSSAAALNTFHPRTVEKCFDSLVTVHFNIKHRSTSTLTESSCDSYTIVVNDVEYNYTYSKIDTISGLKAANGCDSLIILNLTINKTPDVYITGDLRVAPRTNAKLYANSNQNVAYTWSTGATTDSIEIYVEGNMDISLTGRNTATGCENTASVTVMANVSIEGVNDDIMQVYPNPTSAAITVTSAEPVKNISVFNLMGQRVINAEDNTNVNLGVLANGTYVVRIETQNGTVATRTVILSK